MTRTFAFVLSRDVVLRFGSPNFDLQPGGQMIQHRTVQVQCEVSVSSPGVRSFAKNFQFSLYAHM